MLATVINSLGLSSALVAAGVKARVLTAIRMEPIGEFYTKWKAIEAMENGEVVIMSAGTGNPFFTTDTGSSLRGIEIEADVMLKGLMRIDEGLDVVERSVVSYGGVQAGYLEKGCSWITLFIAFCTLCLFIVITKGYKDLSFFYLSCSQSSFWDFPSSLTSQVK